MEYIQIPIPDFSFEMVAKDKANELSVRLLHQHAVWQYGMGINRGLEERLNIAVNQILGKEERLICIKELINHIYKVKENFHAIQADADTAKFYAGVNHILYYLYSLAQSSTGYTFDRNAFSEDEIVNIHTKLNSIIDALNKLQLGQEILYDEFDTVRDQIKEDFNNLRSELVLGKKPFYKMALGTVGSYIGNKTADAIFDQIKPLLVAFFVSQAPHLVEHIEKLLNQINL